MSATIKFNSQSGKRAVEIEGVDTARVLAAEFEVGEAPVAEQTPESFLGVSGFFAEIA